MCIILVSVGISVLASDGNNLAKDYFQLTNNADTHNIFLAAVVAFIGYGRWKLEPIQPRD